VVRTDALLRALSEGRIAGAYLDVTDPEPLPPEHPLWDAPGCVITAHTSGNSPRSGERVLAFYCENLCLWLNGEPLRNVVDREREY
jgi:phosphoglycerate dehydrogenase-like enzyme